MSIIDTLKAVAITIRNEKKKEANTAKRIGDLFVAIIDFIKGLAFGQIRQEGVDTYNDPSSEKTSLLSSYPNPETGWTVLVRNDETNEGKSNLYQWNGSKWINIETVIYNDDVATIEQVEIAKRHFSLFTTSHIRTSDDSFFITEVICKIYPNRYAFLKNQYVKVDKGYDCIIADYDIIENDVSKIYSGKSLYPDKYWWELTELSGNKFIIATKGDDGKWSSPFAPIQSLIDRQFINSEINELENKINGLYTYESFITGIYTIDSGTTVSIGDKVILKYTESVDAFTIRIPIAAKTQVNIYTYQGAYTPAFLVDKDNIVLEVFGDAPKNYLNTPLNITTSYDGYLIINAHEISSNNLLKLKAIYGLARIVDFDFRISVIEDRLKPNKIVTVTKTVKKGGTIGVDCDYTDIKEALNAITDNSSSKRYIINVMDGVYDYSDDGDLIGVPLKNYITIHGQSKNVRIIKRDSYFDWDKAVIDIDKSQKIEYTAIKGAATIINNNCKCPIHIDHDKFIGVFEAENLDLINEQALGTGDNPSEGQANCFAVGWRGDEHFRLTNIRANGKIWGHNYTDKESNGVFELISCNCATIQIGDLTSYGNDKIILTGCKANLYEHLWFSEYKGNKNYQRQSFSFELIGNDIAQSIVADHAGTHNALTDYYNGIYPFALSGIHKIMNGVGITAGSLVKQTGLNTVSRWQTGDKLFGVAVEGSNADGRVLIQYAGIVQMKSDASTSIAFDDELEINASGKVVKRINGSLIGYAMQSNNDELDIKVKLN